MSRSCLVRIFAVLILPVFLISSVSCTTPTTMETAPTDSKTSNSVHQTPIVSNPDPSSVLASKLQQLAKTGSYTAQTLDEACEIAGFRIATPKFIPEGFGPCSYIINQLGAGLPDSSKPKFSPINVNLVWAVKGERSFILQLTQSNHEFGIADANEPVIINGITYKKVSFTADSQLPERLGLAWNDGTIWYSLFGTLAGPLDEPTMLKIASSVRVD